MYFCAGGEQMFRFPVIALVLPLAAWAALTEAVTHWWDDFLLIWSMFDPNERRLYLDRSRELDADMIDHGWHGGFAASSGGDEG